MTVAHGPFPATGSATPDFGANHARIAAANAFMLDLYVSSPAQEALIDKAQTLRTSCLGRRGRPLPGRMLLQESQAGKSSIPRELRRRLAAEDVVAGREVNPHRVLHVELKLRVTVKMLYQRILHALGDPESHGRYNLETLMQRCAEFFALRGTELVFVDEVQYIAKTSRDSLEVADELKGFLDQGLVPVIFMGDLTAKKLLGENQRLTGRLGAPLELPPADKRILAERRAYRTFVDDLDRAVSAGTGCGLARLKERDVLSRLHRASGGHLGRTCRIVEAALEFACARGAERIEVFDLSYAVDHLAMPARWTDANPFPRPSAW